MELRSSNAAYGGGGEPESKKLFAEPKSCPVKLIKCSAGTTRPARHTHINFEIKRLLLASADEEKHDYLRFSPRGNHA